MGSARLGAQSSNSPLPGSAVANNSVSGSELSSSARQKFHALLAESSPVGATVSCSVGSLTSLISAPVSFYVTEGLEYQFKCFLPMVRQSSDGGGLLTSLIMTGAASFNRAWGYVGFFGGGGTSLSTIEMPMAQDAWWTATATGTVQLDIKGESITSGTADVVVIAGNPFYVPTLTVYGPPAVVL